MNWDMITAISAIFGVIAIVVSLLYVARQVKRATRQRGLESYHSVLREVDDFCRVIAHDQSNSDILVPSCWAQNQTLAIPISIPKIRQVSREAKSHAIFPFFSM